ncbi:hypothetical protein L596_026953 [Steinernema carpocapsae]|uniref:Uncharacterized protein n=1 Tax=Steinernema carpocapsae TaxID=34508 RepID=A0A4U5M3T4_STECR|nr:hypothetical protein L596_026953 [Steinernema carpocapsae]
MGCCEGFCLPRNLPVSDYTRKERTRWPWLVLLLVIAVIIFVAALVAILVLTQKHGKTATSRSHEPLGSSTVSSVTTFSTVSTTLFSTWSKSSSPKTLPSTSQPTTSSNALSTDHQPSPSYKTSKSITPSTVLKHTTAKKPTTTTKKPTTTTKKPTTTSTKPTTTTRKPTTTTKKSTTTTKRPTTTTKKPTTTSTKPTTTTRKPTTTTKKSTTTSTKPTTTTRKPTTTTLPTTTPKTPWEKMHGTEMIVDSIHYKFPNLSYIQTKADFFCRRHGARLPLTDPSSPVICQCCSCGLCEETHQNAQCDPNRIQGLWLHHVFGEQERLACSSTGFGPTQNSHFFVCEKCRKPTDPGCH